MKSKIVLFAVVACTLCAVFVLGVKWLKRETTAMRRIVHTHSTQKQLFEQEKRFVEAYTEGPAVEAIKAGMNLADLYKVQVLTTNLQTPEFRAHQIRFNARLSLLFAEVGNEEEATRFASNSWYWFSTIFTNSDLRPENVVSESLARDPVRRAPERKN